MEIINYTLPDTKRSMDAPAWYQKSRFDPPRGKKTKPVETLSVSPLLMPWVTTPVKSTLRASGSRTFNRPYRLTKPRAITIKDLANPSPRVRAPLRLDDFIKKAFDLPSPSLKKVLIFLVSIMSAVTTLLFSKLFIYNSQFSYHRQDTLLSPPALDMSDSLDAALLNHKMAHFARVESNPYDESGNLNGIPATPLVTMKKISFSTYKVQSGDTIVGITRKMGLNNISTLIAINDIDNCSALCAGQTLQIPSMDGVFYTVEEGKTLEGISAKFAVSMEDIIDANALESRDLTAGSRLFIPGAALDKATLEAAIGTFFKSPLSRYRLTSHFGRRLDPITGVKSSHTGIDMAISSGTPITAACSGVVSTAGFSNIFGNYVIINHSNGYQTLYGHMSKILAKKGQWVSQGTRIGLVGSTGYSTGPHLHFTVYKNGRLIDPLPLIK